MGTQNGQGNSNPSGRRFFCDLRFVNITGDLRGVNYLNTLNTENTDNINVFISIFLIMDMD